MESVVIGGGIAALCVGWELARQGAAPLVLRGDRPRASEVAAGMLTPNPEVAISPDIGRLATDSLNDYPGFLDRLGEDSDIDPGFRRSGVLRVAYGDDEAARLRAELPAHHWLSLTECVGENPGLGDVELVGGVLLPEEAQVQPTWLLAALEDGLVRRGGTILATGVKSLSGGDPALLQLGDGGEVRAARVVLAMGAWTGLLPGLELPVRPVKGQLLVFSGVAGPRRILFSGHNYLLQKADGRILLGGTVEELGFSLEPSAEVEGLRGLLPRLWPALVGQPAEVRVGLRPAAPDLLPVVGPVPGRKGVYVFSAHYRNGILLAPLCARLAVAEMFGGPGDERLSTFRVGRLLP